MSTRESRPIDPATATIDVRSLRKAYGELVAVDGVTFEARSGEIFGLLGPNGAGKTTTIGCISGLLSPSGGTVTLLGRDVVREGARARRQLGVVPQELALYDDISARDNLAFWGAAYGVTGAALARRVEQVLELTGLADRGREPVKRFSGGMKRRLNFGCGIVHEPRVLLLDEPTAGVDPQSRVRLLDLVRAQARAGACVVYTTHYMEEAQALCDRLVIIDRGKVLATGTLAELRGLMGEKDLVRLTGAFDPGDSCRSGQSQQRGGRRCRREPDRARRGRGLTDAAGDLRGRRRVGRRHPRRDDQPAEPREPVHQAHRARTARVAHGPDPDRGAQGPEAAAGRPARPGAVAGHPGWWWERCCS